MSNPVDSENAHGKFLYSKHSDDFDLKLPSIITCLREKLASVSEEPEERKIVQSLLNALSNRVTNEINYDDDGKDFAISSQEIGWLNKNPIEQWADYLIFRYKFRVYPRQHVVTDFPLYLLIEPTSACNIRCVMCFQVDKTFTTKKYMGRMPWTLFARTVDEAALKGTKAITLASRGEPTLHPDFGKMLQYISSKQCFLEVKINTNATRLTERLSREILEADINEIVFSVDAGTKQTYEEIRVKGKFDEVVLNIRRFNEIRISEFPNSRVVTRISGVKVRDDQDINQMTDFWSAYVDEVTIKPATPRWDSYNNEINGVTKPCGQLFERMYVWYDGTLNPCDFDYKSELALSSLEDVSLEEAWKSKKYKVLREGHTKGERQAFYPCDRCPL